jgi:hypothetical protein
MGDADKAQAERHDPRDYLDRAAYVLAGLEFGDHPPEVVAYDLARAQAYASMATAAAMLMPTPEEVIATYEETRTEVLGEVQGDLVTRLHRTKRILEDAVRDGSRRHPAIHAALEALGDLDG